MKPYRVRIKREIVADVMPPSRRSRRALILCSGMPSSPSKGSVSAFFAKRGWWVIHPRYRGTWESGGRFLRRSPEEDVRDAIDALSRPMRSVWTDERFTINPSRIAVIGGSFGGTAAVLSMADDRVDAAVALAPVIDWRKPGKDEPMDWLRDVIQEGYGGAFRFDARDWRRLAAGKIYQPHGREGEIDGARLLMIHCRDDMVVPFSPSERFAKKTGAAFRPYKRGGHLGLSDAIEEPYLKHVFRHIAS